LFLLFIFSRGGKRLKKRAGDSASNYSVTRLAAWSTAFTAVFVIWIATALDPQMGVGWGFFRCIVAAVAIVAILLVEALAMSVIELEDKELAEGVGETTDMDQVRRIVDSYLGDSIGYLRAREWFIAGLIVLVTMVVEFEKYKIPFVGTYEGPFVRVLFTGVFASVVVIWMAQSPGKELGKNRPVKFLSLWFGPQQAHALLTKLAKLASWSCINKPAELVSRVLEGALRMTNEPSLPPGGARLFAELIKRYGYGDCNVEEKYFVSPDGSARLEQSETAYLGWKKEVAYVRRISCEQPFLEPPQVVSMHAYVIPALSANLEQDLKNWQSRKLEYPKVRDWEITRNVTFSDDTKKSAFITVSLPVEQLRSDQAYLLEISIAAKWPAKTFRGALCPGADWWSRKPQKPCYEAQTVIALEGGPNQVVIGRVSLEASQDEYGKKIPHTPETERFRRLQHLQSSASPSRNGVPEDGQSLTIKLRYGLPGVRYKAGWEVIEYPSQNTESIGLATGHHDTFLKSQSQTTAELEASAGRISGASREVNSNKGTSQDSKV
jgi:hypothetical protein